MRRRNGGRAVQQRDVELTERQRQVLRLIAAGKTNAEIGEALGISLDGAKWHVSEILSKLDVATREEAAAWWTRREGLAARLVRVLRTLTPGASWLKVGGGVAVLAAVSAAAVVVVALREAGGSEPKQAETTQSVVAIPPGNATPTAPPSPAVIIVDASPRGPSTAVTLRLGPPPASPFQQWDGTSTVIYDTRTSRETNLGPGSQPAYFSPDSTRAVWVKGGGDALKGTEAFLIDLATGATRSLGAARLAIFIDDSHVFIYKPGGNNSESIALSSGARTPGAQNPFGNSPPPRTPDGYEIVPGDSQHLTPDTPTFQVIDPKTHESVLGVVGMAAVPAGPAEIAVASPIVGGQSNIFLIDVKAGAASFIATAAIRAGNWPFAANEKYVMWTDNYCSDNRGQVNLFDRTTRQLIRIDDGATTYEQSYNLRWVKFTPSGLIAAGAFGARYLVDPTTMKYVTVLPAGPGDVSWSSDYRYASHGPTGGHGGLC